MGETARMARIRELAEVRATLFALLSEWQTQMTASAEDLRYGPLAQAADAFIEALADLAVRKVRADVREPSKVDAPPFVCRGGAE